jgi:hypothetical protein
MNILDAAVLILVISLFLMRFLLKVDPRFPIIVAIVFLIASAIFYAWDPNPWAILGFYSFVTGLVLIIIERLWQSLGHHGGPAGDGQTPFLGRLDRIIPKRKKRKDRIIVNFRIFHYRIIIYDVGPDEITTIK